MEKTMKDVEMKITFEDKFVKISDLEERLDFLKNLPIKVVFKDKDLLKIDFTKQRSVRISPLQDETKYEGLENIKDCIINYGKICLELFNQNGDRGIHYYFFTDPFK